jgi:hypothetical protein
MKNYWLDRLQRKAFAEELGRLVKKQGLASKDIRIARALERMGIDSGTDWVEIKRPRRNGKTSNKP